MLGISSACGLFSGCGASGPDTQPATHDDFRAIQRHEAAIDARLPVATDPGSPCEAALDAAEDVCSAADGICRIADETADLDAIDRCDAAMDGCRAAEGAVTGRCDEAP